MERLRGIGVISALHSMLRQLSIRFRTHFCSGSLLYETVSEPLEFPCLFDIFFLGKDQYRLSDAFPSIGAHACRDSRGSDSFSTIGQKKSTEESEQLRRKGSDNVKSSHRT